MIIPIIWNPNFFARIFWKIHLGHPNDLSMSCIFGEVESIQIQHENSLWDKKLRIQIKFVARRFARLPWIMNRIILRIKQKLFCSISCIFFIFICFMHRLARWILIFLKIIFFSLISIFFQLIFRSEDYWIEFPLENSLITFKAPSIYKLFWVMHKD